MFISPVSQRYHIIKNTLEECNIDLFDYINIPSIINEYLIEIKENSVYKNQYQNGVKHGESILYFPRIRDVSGKKIKSLHTIYNNGKQLYYERFYTNGNTMIVRKDNITKKFTLTGLPKAKMETYTNGTKFTAYFYDLFDGSEGYKITYFIKGHSYKACYNANHQCFYSNVPSDVMEQLTKSSSLCCVM